MSVISEKYQEWLCSVIAQTSITTLLPANYGQPPSDAEYPQTLAAATEAVKMVRERALLEFDSELDSAITKLAAIGWSSIKLKIEGSTILLEAKESLRLTSFKTCPWMFDKPAHEFDQTVLGCHLSKMSDANFQLTFDPNRYSASYMHIAWKQDAPLAFELGIRYTGKFHKATALKITYQQVRVLFKNLPADELPSTARDLIARCCADASQISFLNKQGLASLSTHGRTAQMHMFDKELQGVIQKAALQGYSCIVGQVRDNYRMVINETQQELAYFEAWMMMKEDGSICFLEKCLTGKGFKTVRCESSFRLVLTWDADM